MSAWRSPLLYLGIAIILVVAAALVAPHVIDWNRYRPQLEAWGERLTGRRVEVRGDVRVTLFPWPTVTLHDVSVANPPGSRQPDLLQAEEIEARLSLAALFAGRLEVERVRFRRPVIALERLADGTGTWHLAPHARVHLPFAPDRIAIAGIRIEDGTIMLIDGRRGGEARFTELNALISAPRLIGPWRLKATARLQDVPVEIAVTTGTIRTGQPVRLSARLSPREGGGYMYAFDGALRDPEPGRLRGRLKIHPVPPKGKADLAEGLSLYAFSADVAATFDEIELKNIEAAPLSAAHSANTVKGEARILLGSLIEVEAALKAGRLDLDWMLGTDARRLLGAQGLVDAAALVATLPPELVLRLDATASTLAFGGERLHNTRLVLEATSELLAIDSLATALPGGADLTFSGRLLPGQAIDERTPERTVAQPSPLPQLMGRMELKTADLRRLLTWAVPAHAGAIARLWRGSRGRLVLDAKVDATPERLRLFEGTWRLDDAQGELSLLMAPARLDLTVRADALDIDRYVPQSHGEENGKTNPAQSLLELVAAAMTHGEVRLDIIADRMRLWGLPMRGVRVDMQVTPEEARIARFDVADLAGVVVTASGGLTFPEDTVEGRLKARIKGPDVTPLWRLLAGLEEERTAPAASALQTGARMKDTALARLQTLGNIDVQLDLVARGVDQGARLSLNIDGHAGPVRMAAKGTLTGRISRWRKGRIDLTARLESPRSLPLLVLLHATPAALPVRDLPTGRNDLPASLVLAATGTPAEGVKTDLRLEIAGLEAAFLGTLQNRDEETGTTARGRLALRTARLPQVLALIGLGRHPAVPATFWAESDLRRGGRTWRLENLKGRIGETDLGGTLTLTAPEAGAIAALEGEAARWRLTGRLSAAHVHLPALLAVALTRRSGSGPAVFRPAALSLPAAELDLTAEAATLLPGLALRPARLAVTAARTGQTPRLSLNVTAGRKGTEKDGTGDHVALDLTFTSARTGLHLQGELTGGLNLARQLRRTDGMPLLESRAEGRLAFSATGRGPAAMVSGLTGSGRIALTPGRFPRLNVAGFLKAAMAAEEADALDDLLRKTLPSAALPFPGGEGEMRMEAGVLTVSLLTWQQGDLKFTLRPTADLAAERLDIALKVIPHRNRQGEIPPPPAFTLAFAGPPGALELVPDMAELRDWVSVTALARSMARLERIERERRRILEEESAFERRQVMFERWRAWAEERARREAERRARRDRLIHARERQMRDLLIRLRLQLKREEATRRAEERRRRALERQRQIDEQRRLERQRQREQGHRRQQQHGAPPGPHPEARRPSPPRKRAMPPATSTGENEIRDILRALKDTQPPPESRTSPSASRPSAAVAPGSPPPKPQARPEHPTGSRLNAATRRAPATHKASEAQTGPQKPARGPIRIAPLPPDAPPPRAPRRITNFGSAH